MPGYDEKGLADDDKPFYYAGFCKYGIYFSAIAGRITDPLCLLYTVTLFLAKAGWPSRRR